MAALAIRLPQARRVGARHPGTILRWHRRLVAQPPTPVEPPLVRALVKRLVVEDPSSGYRWIQGELYRGSTLTGS